MPEQIFSNRTKRLKSQSASAIMKKYLSLPKSLQKIVHVTYIMFLIIWTILSNKCLWDPTKLICGLLVFLFLFSFGPPFLWTAFRHWVWSFPMHHSSKSPLQAYSIRFLLYRKWDRLKQLLDGNQRWTLRQGFWPSRLRFLLQHKDFLSHCIPYLPTNLSTMSTRTLSSNSA